MSRLCPWSSSNSLYIGMQTQEFLICSIHVCMLELAKYDTFLNLRFHDHSTDIS